MFPTDDEEFLILYVVYIGLLLFLLLSTIFLKDNKGFKNNLVFFSIYTAIMLALFSNENNFKNGGSLVVLFYGGIFILLHLTIFMIRRTFIFLSTRKK